MKRVPSKSRSFSYASCPCMGRNLQKLVQPLILASLAGGSLHGYAITDQIASHKLHAGSPPNHSAIYRLLRGMERKGLLTSQLIQSSAGPARREYSLTTSGYKCLGLWMKSLSGYRDTIDAIMTLCKGAGKSGS